MFRKKSFRLFLTVIVLLVIVYLLGPHPSTPVYDPVMPAVPQTAAGLEKYIHQKEAAHTLKPNNQARIVWYNDSLKEKTVYAIVYLHGFSASQEEGYPVHTNIARAFGCNLYLSRLAEHGIDTAAPLKNLTASAYWESARDALAIGKQLGEKVILMGTSTGGTNALQLAATYPDDVYALVLLSPNIAIDNDKAWLLNDPWGLQIASFVTGSDYVTSADDRPIYKQYWYSKYPLDATAQLEEYLETTMTAETFKKVKQPVLMLYYYKDEVYRDSVVSVPAMLKMFDELGTAKNNKVKQSMPNAGNHVLGSYIKSKDLLGVQQAVESFMERKLHLNKASGTAITTVTSGVNISIKDSAP
ncbi:alpha/beta hydrolase [Agriterribacter sp.]|uniref:alpha/beta hydrolase n=1 Tax=Agriterribacter sp. TaxID=2821509 RepID=UPI002D1CFEB3|nr:alpha/beta hydrolase [Agriterribacter sp.]HRP56773.1 alpha/beta hydrolase [Agriterribacter sp.]